jgi:hypothetical protein
MCGRAVGAGALHTTDKGIHNSFAPTSQDSPVRVITEACAVWTSKHSASKAECVQGDKWIEIKYFRCPTLLSIRLRNELLALRRGFRPKLIARSGPRPHVFVIVSSGKFKDISFMSGSRVSSLSSDTNMYSNYLLPDQSSTPSVVHHILGILFGKSCY